MYTIQDYHSKKYILSGYSFISLSIIVVDYDDKWRTDVYKKGVRE